jgi:fibronectin type 3 domain-containing protein
VRVTWQGPSGQYRVFRRAESEKEFALVATVDATQWLDAATEYGKQYTYLVQGVKKAGVSEAETDLSDPYQVKPIDTFPPAVPSGLNAIIATSHIELVWDRNTESDLALYRLYRGVAGGSLERLADIPDAPSYSDMKVESGKQYRYAVSAVDRLGNESKQSSVVEILAP